MKRAPYRYRVYDPFRRLERVILTFVVVVDVIVVALFAWLYYTRGL